MIERFKARTPFDSFSFHLFQRSTLSSTSRWSETTPAALPDHLTQEAPELRVSLVLNVGKGARSSFDFIFIQFPVNFLEIRRFAGCALKLHIKDVKII